MRRLVLLFAALGTAVAIVGLAFTGEGLLTDNQQAEAQIVGRPNIVFVMADDLDERSMQDLSGIRQVMNANGTTFENAYVTFPLCCPSRATILRGQYPHNHGIRGNSPQRGGGEQKFRDQRLDESTVATWLDDAGYRTKYIGKYMNGYGNGETYIPPGWDEWFVLNDRPQLPNVNDDGQSITITGNSTEAFAEEAGDFIRRSSANPEPFFAVVGTHAPHTPPAVAERHEGAFAETQLPTPPNFDEEYISDKPRWVRQYPRLSQTEIDELEKLYRERLRSMLSVEDLLEQVIGTLDQTDELENTYIFFTSDNGFHMGNHRLYPAKKETPYEEDIGVPLVVRGPGVPAGEVREQLVLNNDFAPTMADLADASADDFVDGSSFAPLLTGSPPPSWRSAFVAEQWWLDEPLTPPLAPTFKGVHTNEHMLVEYETGENELYDLGADPYQLKSKPRAGNERLYSELERRLSILRACSGAGCRNAEWDPRVVSTLPTPNATGVDPATNLTATFSEGIDPATLTKATFKLFKVNTSGSTTQVTNVTVTPSPDGVKATLDPFGTSSTLLSNSARYKAVVTTGVKDPVGNPLDQDSSIPGSQQKTWLFTVSN